MLTTIEESANLLEPIFGSRYLQRPIPKFALPEKEISKEAAYQIVHDELLFDGNPRLNLASFVTTWMEPECDKLIMESLNKNFIDYDEYPATLDIQDRCVNMIARLFHAPLKDNEVAIGTSTVGSSEAIMLAGLAMKRKWQQRRKQEGKPYDKPNMIAGSNVQVCWEKFARYFEVELREVKLQEGRFVMDPFKAVELVDENTILVCAILGSTYNGEFEDVKTLNDLLLNKNKITGWNTPIHVDAASGGFIAPFIYPSLEWDFRLPLVKSINVSGHKYGLVYPGIGWAIWRSKEDLPEDLIFHINYLGSDQPSFTLNFTKGASHVIAQYYQFLRLGFEGYKSIARSCQENAAYLTERIKESGKFRILSKAVGVPVVTFSILKKVGVSEYDVADRLRQYGWIVPAYTMAPDLQHMNVLRVVVREDFRRSQADKLLLDIETVMGHLQQRPKTQPPPPAADHDEYADAGYMSEGHTLPSSSSAVINAETTGRRLGVMEQIQKFRARRNSKLGTKTTPATAPAATPPPIQSTLTHRHRHLLRHRHLFHHRRSSAPSKHAAIC